ncbi:9408_t:CDS:2 [Acaulospora morrowiae]|uniref:9408_t:CDS:1 n=1 Tax=Acaulospora morrowiae TaxID=94023 RepID=A0A9N9BAA5_9GLOM|nr:9408_t:CDS:2 [Acaulospora morrowiae]
MATILAPTFSGNHDEDIDIFISCFSAYLAGIDVNPVGVARDRAFGILRGCLSGSALDWFDRKILGKRWELHNILANHGQANIAGVQGRTMAQMNNTNIGNSMVPAEAFIEDWHLAEGRSSDRPVNAMNAANNNPIIFDNIRIGQALYWLKNKYPTVLSKKHNLVFGSLAQGDDPLGVFYSKLRKYRKMLNHDEEQIKGQFLRGLFPDLEDDAERIGTEQPLEDLFTTLERIETRRLEKRLGLVSKIPQSGYKPSSKSREKDYYSSDTGMTEANVRNLVKSIMSEQSQPVSQTISSKSQDNQITLSQDDFKKIVAGLKGVVAKGQQTLKKSSGPGKQKADIITMNHFLDEAIDNTSLPGEKYDYDPIEDLRLQFEQLGINQAKMARVIHAVSKLLQYKCSKCGKPGHTVILVIVLEIKRRASLIILTKANLVVLATSTKGAKKKRMSYEELKKSLYEVLASKVKLMEFNRKLQLHINKSKKVTNSDILYGMQNTLEKAKID